MISLATLTTITMTNTQIETEPRNDRDLITIPSCLVRKHDANGNYIATGEVKDKFKWVFEDPTVICCEHIHGTNINVLLAKTEVGDQWQMLGALTRNSTVVGLSSWQITMQIWESMRRGLISSANVLGEIWDGIGAIPGVIPYMGRISDSKINKLNSWPWFIPRKHQLKKMRYSQFGQVTPTVENISDWLREDLKTHLPSALAPHIGCGRPKLNSDSYRPSGLLFYQPSTGALARISCDHFDWYYEEGLGKISKKTKSKHTKEYWDSLTDEQKTAHRKAIRTAKFRSV